MRRKHTAGFKHMHKFKHRIGNYGNHGGALRNLKPRICGFIGVPCHLYGLVGKRNNVRIEYNGRNGGWRRWWRRGT